MKRNYKYAKLINGELEYAPNILYIGDRQIINAAAEEYASFGWMPIVKTEHPEEEENSYYKPYYTEENGKIIQRWERYEVTL